MSPTPKTKATARAAARKTTATTLRPGRSRIDEILALIDAALVNAPGK